MFQSFPDSVASLRVKALRNVFAVGLVLSFLGCSSQDEAGLSEEVFPPADPNGPVTVVVSEMMAANDSGLRDRDGDYSDWIELHNHGAEPVQLQGCYLTDDPALLTKWPFPELVIRPGDYVLVFASGKDLTDVGEWHTNFKLQAKGDFLALIGRDGQTMVSGFESQFPRQRRDISYGLLPEVVPGSADSTSYGFLYAATPGTPNGIALLGEVDGLQVSVERGFFTEPFEVELSTRTADAEIRYTTDGSLPTATHGSVYRAPLVVDRTMTIRAGAFKEQHRSTRVKTYTYLFPKDVIHQSPDGLPPEGFPYSWGQNAVDYGMDPEVVNDPGYRDEVVEGLLSIPSFSVVLPVEDMFGENDGIYANPQQDGRAWERACSVEYLLPSGEEGFQIDCGIRIRGGFSRRPANPKHALRLFFRDVYGPSKLEYPLFGESGAQVFDNLDLRTFQNYSWSMSGDARAVFMRDQFNRDLQLAMGQPAARGEYCHLYINGQYWGLYDTCERPEASYGETYFGGKKASFDVVKRADYEAGTAIMATDGNLDAWRTLWERSQAGLSANADYQALLGRNADGTPNPDYEVLLDPDNLIDYMLLILYGGNLDAPISRFMGNQGPNNWYGVRNRKGRQGFRFFVWDAEHTLLEPEEDRTGPFPAGNEFGTSNPQWIWQQCLDNEEFRMRVADLVHKRFYRGGILTARAVRKRFVERAAGIAAAVVCESARWGDAAGQGLMNRDDHWEKEFRRIADEYIPVRSDIVLGQLYRHGLVPDLGAPTMSHSERELDPGTEVTLSAAEGTIYYTVDGTDPRMIGGDVATTAVGGVGPIPIKETTLVRARVRMDDEWGPLTEQTYAVKGAL